MRRNISWEVILLTAVATYLLGYSLVDHTPVLSQNLSENLAVLPPNYVEKSPHNSVAYVQYATNLEYMKLAVNNLVHLENSETKGDLLVIYSRDLAYLKDFPLVESTAIHHKIKLVPVDTIRGKSKNTMWGDSLTKLHIFNLDYERIIYFDSDSILKEANLDELFDIPSDITIAMPQAYWLSDQELSGKDIPTHGVLNSMTIQKLLRDEHKYDNRDSFFGTHVVVVKPSKDLFKGLMRYVENPWYYSLFSRSKLIGVDDFDMEIINRYINDMLAKGKIKVGILDHRIYGVLTGEFRKEWHGRFCADPQYMPFVSKTSNGNWNATNVFQSAKLFHFSDDPIPKPWKPQNNYEHYNSFKIYCISDGIQQLHQDYPINKPRVTEDCESVHAWNEIRQLFTKRYLFS